MRTMLLLPTKLRDNLRGYIMSNPSPATSVGQVMQLLNELQGLSTYGKPAAVPEVEDGPAVSGEEVADG